MLANALYFKAAWAQPFQSGDTKSGPFTLHSGEKVTADFMHTVEPVLGAQTASYQAVQLPYAGGRFAAVAIMPSRGSVTDFVGGLDQAGLANIVSSLRLPTSLGLPKFKLTSSTTLNDVLKQMGMPDAFNKADFSVMNAGAEPLSVKTVLQKTYLKVDEAGTEAAAVTGIQAVASSGTAGPILSITLDHPFLFLIRDTTTGAILFESEIQNPEG